MKILITGSNGQLGNSIRMISGNYPDIDFVFTDIEELDITDNAAVKSFIQQHQPECLINCAAYTAVDQAESDKEKAWILNVQAPGILAKNMAQEGGRMIHVSTDYVFDGEKKGKYTENDDVNPKTIYGKTKAEGELKVLKYKGNIVVRTAWLYSVFGKNFFKTMLQLMAEKNEISVVNDQLGTPSYAPDLAKALLLLSGLKEVEGIFHYSNEGETTWWGFAREIGKLAGSSCHIKGIPGSEYPVPAARPANSVLSKEKIKKITGLSVPDWKDSLKLCYESFKTINSK